MAGKVPSVYLGAPGRTGDYFKKLQGGTAPARFTTEFLENLGFRSKADRQLIPLLKALGFIDESNVPTQAYRDYLDDKRGRTVLAKQILSAYEGLFELDKNAHKAKAADLTGSFKSLANASDAVADFMATTFVNLCAIADIDGYRKGAPEHEVKKEVVKEEKPKEDTLRETPPVAMGLHYHIELHLPNTTDIEVFRQIFKAMKEQLLS